MEQGERACAGLESAWNPGLLTVAGGGRSLAQPLTFGLPTAASFRPAPTGAKSDPPLAPDAPAFVPVLIATCPCRTAALFEWDLLASMHWVGRVYRVESVQVACALELVSHCRRQTPRLLLVDVALIAPEGASALRDLRRRLPATDWLLGWESPSPQGLSAAVRSQARGCVDWAASAGQLTQALDAVLAGVLWFSAPVLQALYLSLIESAVSTELLEPGAASPSGRLTAREDEVLSLMRRGMTNKQIAERLDISVNTVKKHLAHVFNKHGLHGRRQQIA